GLSSGARQLLPSLSQAGAIKAEFAFKHVAAGTAKKAEQCVVRQHLIGCITKRVASALASDKGAHGPVACRQREANAELLRTVQEVEIGAVAEPEQRIRDCRKRGGLAGLVGAMHDVQAHTIRKRQRHVGQMSVAQQIETAEPHPGSAAARASAAICQASSARARRASASFGNSRPSRAGAGSFWRRDASSPSNLVTTAGSSRLAANAARSGASKPAPVSGIGCVRTRTDSGQSLPPDSIAALRHSAARWSTSPS